MAYGWKRRIAQLAFSSLLTGALYGQTHWAPADPLRHGFAHPPSVAKLRCYWWWLNGNTNEATITRDLTEMSRKGFGGVLLVDADGSEQQGNEKVLPGPTFGSPQWIRLYVFALKTASARHLEVTLNATSGWNLGGPDVTPAQASKLLTWSRTTTGEKGFDGVLPMPPIKNGFYQQIAVLAYPLAHQLGVAQVVLLVNELIKAFPLLRQEEPDLHPLEQAGFFFGDYRCHGRFHAGQGRDSADGCPVLFQIPLSLRQFRRS